MSEYQYYEFLAVDCPLSKERIQAVGRFSTRAEITSTRFVNEYNWGDFRGDVQVFLAKYFDLHVYVANWGTRCFAFRVPTGLVDVESAEAYSEGNGLVIRPTKEAVVFYFNSEDEDREEDDHDGSGWMGPLAPLREEVLSGDRRAFYLAWLAQVREHALEEDELEPPVPPGLGALSAAQRALAEFLRLGDELLAVAAEASPPIVAQPDGLAGWIAALPETEKNDLLLRACDGREPHIGTSLRRRFQAMRGPARCDAPSGERRTVGQLAAAAECIVQRRREEEARRRAAARARQAAEEARLRSEYLADLATRQPAAWEKVETLIATKVPKRYQEAISLLRDLHALAAQSGSQTAFASRMAELRERHAKKRALLEGLARAGLGSVNAL